MNYTKGGFLLEGVLDRTGAARRVTFKLEHVEQLESARFFPPANLFLERGRHSDSCMLKIYVNSAYTGTYTPPVLHIYVYMHASAE